MHTGARRFEIDWCGWNFLLLSMDVTQGDNRVILIVEHVL